MERLLISQGFCVRRLARCAVKTGRIGDLGDVQYELPLDFYSYLLSYCNNLDFIFIKTSKATQVN
jgi:hypothetical protein